MAVEASVSYPVAVSAATPRSTRLALGLLILTAIYTMSFIDRQVLSLLIQPIKLSMTLSDTQLGLLQGLAFTISYVVLGPVFGRLADRYSRRNIIVAGLVVWTACSAGSGLANSFHELLVSRLLLGATEACLTPAVWSMLSDMFDEKRLPRALSIFLMGPYLGGGLALVFGGMILDAGRQLQAFPVLANMQPWQITFVLISLPGFVLAAALMLVREPARRQRRAGDVIGWAEIRQALSPRRSFYIPFFVGMAALDCVLYVTPAWLPTLLIRQFAVGPAVVGSLYGWGTLIAGSSGVLAGPFIARAIEARRGRRDALLTVGFLAATLLVVASMSLLLATSMAGVLTAALAMSFLYTVPQALAASALTLATPPNLRGVVTAWYILIVTVTGYGFAPVAVGWLAEHTMPAGNPLGLAIGLFSALASTIAAIALYRAGGGYVQARRIETDEPGNGEGQQPRRSSVPNAVRLTP